MNWNPELAKPLLKRAVAAAIVLAPIVGVTSYEPAKPAEPPKQTDTLKVFRKGEPSKPANLPARTPAQIEESLFNDRCLGIEPPAL